MLSLEQDSFVLQELKSYSPEQLLFLSTDRAPTTLKRHLSGWRRWAEFFRRCCDIPLGAPGCKSLLDFLEALAEGARSNRGKCRSQAATGVVGLCFSLRLAEAGVTSLRTLHGPIVRAWLAAGKWDGHTPKEALPVHFTAVRALEAAVSPDVEDSWLTIEVDKESVRGWGVA